MASSRSIEMNEQLSFDNYDYMQKKWFRIPAAKAIAKYVKDSKSIRRETQITELLLAIAGCEAIMVGGNDV